jgi:hypothetical protein
MKKFAAFLAIVAISMFTVGCNPPAKTSKTEKTTKTTEIKSGDKTTIETKTSTESSETKTK